MHKLSQTNRRRILAIGGCTSVLTVFGVRGALAQNVNTDLLFSTALPGIATISSQCFKRNNIQLPKSFGVGFVLEVDSKPILVTAAHVIEQPRESVHQEIFAHFSDCPACRVEVFAVDAASDLAMLGFVDNPPANLKPLRTSEARTAQTVFLIGRIVSSDNVRRVGNLTNATDKEIDTVTVQTVTEDKIGFKSPYFYQGKSGSPLINDAGNALGMFLQTSVPNKVGDPITGVAISAKKIDQFIVAKMKNGAPPPAAQKEVLLAPAPNLAGFVNAAQVQPLPVVQGLQRTFVARDSQNKDISRQFSWAATSAQLSPRNVRPEMNMRVLRIVGRGKGIVTDGRDHFIENNFLGFSSLLGSTFVRFSEEVFVPNRIFRFDAASADDQHRVHLRISPVLQDFYFANLRSLNLNDVQIELSNQRRNTVKLFLNENDARPVRADERVVNFGPVDDLLRRNGIGDWNVFRDKRNIPWCSFRYRSYVSLAQPTIETVALYVYQIQTGLIYVAWFDRQNSADLDFSQQSAIDQWAFLLSLCIYPIQ